MTGVTQNIYTGLSDFFDCSFLLHLLRDGDLFVDVGANAGIYTVLAAGAVGAMTIAVEPIPHAFRRLCANIAVNGVHEKVVARNIGLGSRESTLRFTSNRDTMNKVIQDSTYGGPSIDVPVLSLDSILQGKTPRLIKIDVEGWESEVIAGASATLRDRSLLGLIVEMNGGEASLNENEHAVHKCLLENGFRPHLYNPVSRSLSPIPSKNSRDNNTLYVRDTPEIDARLRSAPKFRVGNKSF
jgi:FkbM family methyltransferase